MVSRWLSIRVHIAGPSSRPAVRLGRLAAVSCVRARSLPPEPVIPLNDGEPQTAASTGNGTADTGLFARTDCARRIPNTRRRTDWLTQASRDLVFITGFVVCLLISLIVFLDLRPVLLGIFGFLSIGLFPAASSHAAEARWTCQILVEWKERGKTDRRAKRWLTNVLDVPDLATSQDQTGASLGSSSISVPAGRSSRCNARAGRHAWRHLTSDRLADRSSSVRLRSQRSTPSACDRRAKGECSRSTRIPPFAFL